MPGSKRTVRPPKFFTTTTTKKSRIQLLKEQPAVDVIELATNIDANIERAKKVVERGQATISSITVTQENIEAIRRLVEVLREDYDNLLILYTQLEYAHKIYENSTASFILDRSRANLYTESKGQSLLPPELT